MVELGAATEANRHPPGNVARKIRASRLRSPLVVARPHSSRASPCRCRDAPTSAEVTCISREEENCELMLSERRSRNEELQREDA